MFHTTGLIVVILEIFFEILSLLILIKKIKNR